jgi:hypothetical protein
MMANLRLGAVATRPEGDGSRGERRAESSHHAEIRGDRFYFRVCDPAVDDRQQTLDLIAACRLRDDPPVPRVLL